MLTKDITFKDLDGTVLTETFYFNLSETELAEMELTENGNEGLGTLIGEILKSEDNAEIFRRFKWIFRKSYGIRSDDGRRFIKKYELWEEFTQTDAYNVFFMEMITNPVAVAEFITNVIPGDIAAKLPPDVLDFQNVDKDSSEKTPEVKPWADREPTREELASMSREELIVVMQRKNASQQS